MKKDKITIQIDKNRSLTIPVHTMQTLIIGAGAAGLKCADALYHLGIKDIAIVVDELGSGTSNNAGSDKQTYYKIGLFGDEPDSPMEFARSLYHGGMMHGDIAYVEALGSAPAFFDLCRIGVPFPHNQYGAYVGYKTDHDPRQRATSAGPKTSMWMFQKRLEQVRRNETPILNHHEAVKLLYSDQQNQKRVIGALCIDKEKTDQDNFGLTTFNAENVVMATGGPGEMYEISVYPPGQIGSHGLALEIGAKANNLTELQFGLASVKFRWNLSGTYQQVIPDYFSTDEDGVSGKRSFLHDYFDDMSEMATFIFLKGYQWPFNAERVQNGSSLIDIAVHNEIRAGRRVFLDFMHNLTPAVSMRPFNISELHDEARNYLERSGALQNTPYQRLKHMNPQSIDLYAEHNIDLRHPLEVAVCAQHCNGGISVNLWWETSIKHLFAIGELAGTHGIRPGGSALNSGQIGAMRTAQFIAHRYRNTPIELKEFQNLSKSQIINQYREYESYLNPKPEALNPSLIRKEIQHRMSREGAFIRSHSGSTHALKEASELVAHIQSNGIRCCSQDQLNQVTENKMLALTSMAFLKAIVYFIEHGGGSRGGYMILDDQGDLCVESKRGKELRHRSENREKRKEILEVKWNGVTFQITPTTVRPLPEDNSWFETVWRDWNEGKIF